MMTWNEAHNRFNELLDELEYIAWLWKISEEDCEPSWDRFLIQWYRAVERDIAILKVEWFYATIYGAA